MLKLLSTCALVVVCGIGSASAQQQDTMMQKLEVPGADFDIIVATSPQREVKQLSHESDSLTAYPIGGELAFATEAELKKIFKDVGPVQLPIYALQVNHSRGRSSAIVYVVPKWKMINAAK